eukprot:jgi/Mesvir1/19601/Mv09898-RA.1
MGENRLALTGQASPSDVANTSDHDVTLDEILARIPLVGETILGLLPVIDGIRFRRLSKTFLACMDNALKKTDRIFGDDLARANPPSSLLLWLAGRSPLEIVSVCPPRRPLADNVPGPYSPPEFLYKRPLERVCELDDRGLMSLAFHCKRLRFLDVQGCPGVTDIGIVSVILNCPKLEFLDFHGCKRVTGTTARMLLLSPAPLKFVDMSHTGLVADDIEGVIGPLVSKGMVVRVGGLPPSGIFDYPLDLDE